MLLTAVGGTCRSDYKPLSIDEDDVNPSLMSMTTEQWDHLIELYIEEVAHPQEIDNPAEQTSADVFCPLMLHLAATKAKAWKGFTYIKELRYFTNMLTNKFVLFLSGILRGRKS